VPILKNSKTLVRDLWVKLSCETYAYIALYSVAKGIPKGTLIRSEMEKWQKYQSQNDSEWILLKEITTKIDRKWHNLRDKNPKASLEEFKKAVIKELRKKNLTHTQIVLILKEIT
jgi:hypothetical protein